MASWSRPRPWRERLAFETAQRRWWRERHDAQFRDGRHLADLAADLRSLAVDRPTHVVVVPQEGETFTSFRPGTRNLYWEAGQRLREMLGDEAVSFVSVAPGEPATDWHRRVLEHVSGVGATHLITHIESDPGSAGAAWTWDVPCRVLAEAWDGPVLGVLFDSAFPWITAKARLLARLSPNFVGVDICMPLDGELIRRRPEVGPVNMPISDASMRLVDHRLADVRPQWDLSFIGAMYPYRVDLVARLRAEGLSVAVNPHRAENAEDFESSRRDQPDWLEYMTGLRRSQLTINFSRSSAGPLQQLKTRVLEATVAGTVLLTDDVDRTSRFWVQGSEYASFRSPEDIPSVAKKLLGDPEVVREMAASAQHRARDIASLDFWTGIDRGLRRRKLTAVLPEEVAPWYAASPRA